MNPMTAPDIVVKDLALDYDGGHLFAGLNFRIPAKQCVGLLGVSGVGKTSLLKILAGLLKPKSGTVMGSDGHTIDDKIAYMAQQDLLFPWLTVIQNVCLGARLRGEKADRDKALSLLEQVGLAEAHNKLPHVLSGGMRQRAAIARTLYENRPIVLMDEPFSALDAVTRCNIQELSASLLQQKTVVLVTHDPAEAARLCQQIFVLHHSRSQPLTSMAVGGTPPRALDDPHFLASQLSLMQTLREGAK